MNSQVPFKQIPYFFSRTQEKDRWPTVGTPGVPTSPIFQGLFRPQKILLTKKKSIIIFAKRCAKYWKMKQAKKRGELGVYQGLFIRLIKSSLFLAPKRALKFTLNFTEGERVRAWISYKRASWRYILQTGGEIFYLLPFEFFISSDP